jgi:hypothetical protein
MVDLADFSRLLMKRSEAQPDAPWRGCPLENRWKILFVKAGYTFLPLTGECR